MDSNLVVCAFTLQNTLKRIKNLHNIINNLLLKFDKSGFIIHSICFILLFTSLLIFKTRAYKTNLSSLIGIYSGFAIINPDYKENDFVIFNNGGYDGQFFYLNAKYLFEPTKEIPPILDAFEIRFRRIGFSIITGFFSSLIGFKFYAYISLTILLFFHLLSSYLLLKLTKSPLYLFYLFSPFSIISNLLLVSDSLFASFFIISIYLLKEIGFNFFPNETDLKYTSNKKFNEYLIPVIFILLVFGLIKETGIVFISSFIIHTLVQKQWKFFILFFSIISILLSFYISLKFWKSAWVGSNPLEFTQLIDYPFFGFIKSIKLAQLNDPISLFKEFAIFSIFALHISLGLQLFNIKSIKGIIPFLPIAYLFFAGTTAEVGYWLTYDNIARFYTFSIPMIIIFASKFINYKTYYFFIIEFIILVSIILKYIGSKEQAYTLWN